MRSITGDRGNAGAAAGGFAIGAAGIALQALGGMTTRWPAPPGAVILLAAAATVAFVRRPALGVSVAVPAFLVAVLRFTANPGALLGSAGAVAAIGQWLLLTGIVAVLVAGANALRGRKIRHRRTTRIRDDDIGTATAAEPPRHRLQVTTLLVLAPIGAEYLAAYDSSTGDPAALLAGLLIFVPLYGAPALIIREVARRAELGWTGIILMATGFGLLQAGVVDQSLFSEDYRGIESWMETLRASYIEPLGISLYNAFNFVGGHVIYSICAPIAIAEALRPRAARKAWLGNVGLGVVSLLYALASLLVLTDHLQNETSHASIAQVAVSLLIVTLLIAAAFRLGGRERFATSGRPTIRRTFVVSMVLIVAYSVGPENWTGALLAAGSLFVAAVLLWRASHAVSWGLGHMVAIATAALLTRASLAFLYFPVIGDVSAARKYGHNVVLLGIVSAACTIAWRHATHSGPEPSVTRVEPKRSVVQ